MKLSQLAAQLYTVREHVKTPTDLAATLRKIKQIGYPAVQVSAVPVDDQVVAELLREEGLLCCALHHDSAQLLADPKSAVKRLDTLDCRNVSYPFPSGIRFDSPEDVRALAAKLNAAGEVIVKAGKSFSYHNHSIEFRRVSGGLIFETILSETDPRYVQAELDTYWVQHGGGDPVAWCRRLRGRLPLLHLKDYVIDSESKPTFAEIGSGNLDWKGIIAAAEEAGAEWYIVEQDICARDPFESLKMSFDYLTEHFAGR